MATNNLESAVIIDGGFFSKVSQYYRHNDLSRTSHLDFAGLEGFVRKEALSKVAAYRGQEVHIKHREFHHGSRIDQDERGYGSLDGRFQNRIRQAGYRIVWGRMYNGHEMDVDDHIQDRIRELASSHEADIIVLVTGDGDHTAAVWQAADDGLRVVLVTWNLEGTDGKGFPVLIGSSSLLKEAVLLTGGVVLQMDKLLAPRHSMEPEHVRRLFVANTRCNNAYLA